MSVCRSVLLHHHGAGELRGWWSFCRSLSATKRRWVSVTAIGQISPGSASRTAPCLAIDTRIELDRLFGADLAPIEHLPAMGQLVLTAAMMRLER
jgi:hypothetical protein